MDITITLSPEQEYALTRSNDTTNSNPATRPTLQAFAQSVFNQKAKEHVDAWNQRDAFYVREKLEANILTMTREDRETVVTVLDKYQIPKPIEVDPVIVEEPQIEGEVKP